MFKIDKYYSFIFPKPENFNIFQSKGYNLSVYDDLQAIGVKHAADIHVELVKLVNGLSCAHIPKHSVVQHQVVCWVKSSAVFLVVVSQVWVVESKSDLSGLDVINLAQKRKKCSPFYTAILSAIVYILLEIKKKKEMLNYTYTCYMFLCSNDTILGKLTELHIMVPKEGMPKNKTHTQTTFLSAFLKH